MVDIFTRTLSHFRKKANFNIFFPYVEWIFPHFRKANFKIWENLMEWWRWTGLYYRLFHKVYLKIFPISKVSLSALSHRVIIRRTSLGNRPTLYFGFMGGLKIVEDLKGPKTLGDLQSLLHTMGLCWNNSVWGCYFSCKLVGYQSPFDFIFCQTVGLTYEVWYACRQGGAIS